MCAWQLPSNVEDLCRLERRRLAKKQPLVVIAPDLRAFALKKFDHGI